MNDLKNVFKPTASKNNSSKTPAFYNQQKTDCILDCATHESVVVRSAIASGKNTPAKILTGMLEIEQDRDVLRTVLMNERLSRKAVAKFVNDPTDERVQMFEGDQELIDHFQK